MPASNNKSPHLGIHDWRGVKAGDTNPACKHESVVVHRENAFGSRILRPAADAPRHRGTEMHVGASRSAARFADRVVLVEAITDVVLLRAFGHAWATRDDAKAAFIEALGVLPIGNQTGYWLDRLLATPGQELVDRVAVLADTDLLPAAAGLLPPETDRQPLQAEHETGPRVRTFWSKPTLEPTLVPFNEELVQRALDRLGHSIGGTPTAHNIGALFQTTAGRQLKDEFAFELAAIVDASESQAHVPQQLEDLFNWLWMEHPGLDPASHPRTR